MKDLFVAVWLILALGDEPVEVSGIYRLTERDFSIGHAVTAALTSPKISISAILGLTSIFGRTFKSAS